MSRFYQRAFMSASSVFALLIAAPAIAAPMAVEEILVRDQPSGSPTSISPEAARELMKQIPGGASFVTSEDFENRYAVGFQDMLAAVPGVFAHQRYGEEVRLSVRGSGVSRSFHLRGIRLLLDGIPLTAADGGGDFQEIDPLTVRYLEVYKGGNGLRYGAASLGGAINVVAPTARTVAYSGLMQAEGGSFGTARLHGAYAWQGETADAYIAATGVTSNGYREQSHQNNARISANAGFKVGDAGETRFYLWANEINQEVPGAISLTAALHEPRTVLPINVANDYARNIQSVRFANRTALPLGNGRVEFGAYGTVKSLYHPIFQVIDQDSKETGTFARWSGDAAGFNLSFGGALGWGTIDAKRYVNVGGKRGALTADSDQKSLNVELYGEARRALSEKLTAIAAAQWVYARRSYDDILAPVNDDRESFAALSPKFGLILAAADDVQIFANVSRSYEPPTFSELVQFPVVGFVPLDAQRAWTAEAGSRGKTEGVDWDVTAYWSWVKGEMLQFTVNPSIPAATFNADKTIHRGLEAGFGIEITDNVRWRVSYTFNDFRFRDDAQFGDNRIAGIPRHIANMSLSYRHDSGITLTPNVEWAMSRTYVDFANTMTVPRYAIVNLAASWRRESGWRLFVDANNLTNKHYVSDLGTVTNAAQTSSLNVFYPGDGRAVFAGLALEF